MPRAASRPRFALAHRAGSQFSLVAAAWAVVLVCASLAGFAAALAGPGHEHALSASVAAIDTGTERTDVTSLTAIAEDLTDVEPISVLDAVAIANNQLSSTAGDYEFDISVWVAGSKQFLPGDVAQRGYLLDADSASANAVLEDGSWPTERAGDTLEVAVPVNVARALELAVGDTVRLGGNTMVGGGIAPFTDVEIVGTFTPVASEVWNREPLRGAGIGSAPNQVRQLGPFLTAPGALSEGDHELGRISAELDPHLGSDPSGVARMVRATTDLREHAREPYGDAVRWVVVRSQLGAAYAEAKAHVQLSTSLAVSVLVTLMAVALAAVALMAELVSKRRTAETAVLKDRGASRVQLGKRAGTEAAAIGLAAAAIAAPLAWLAFVAVSRSGRFGTTWTLGTPVDAASLPTSVWVGAGLAALTATGVLVIVALRDRGRTPFARRSKAGALARSGADLALGIIAIVGIVQLRTHTPTDGRVDPLLVLVPAACVLASAALVARVLPRVARLAERVPRRSLGVASALAGWHVARGGAMRGTFLAVAAAATATLGTVFLATWSHSLDDQADAAVGAEVVVGQEQPPGGGRALADSAGGDLHPVVDRPVVLGTRPDGVALFAIESSVAEATVTGRPQGVDSWEDAIAMLGADRASDAMTVDGPTVSLDISGTLNEPRSDVAPFTVLVAPTVVVSDEWGATLLLRGDTVPLDGTTRTVRATLPAGTEATNGPWTVQAVQLQVTQAVTGDLFSISRDRAQAEVSVTVRNATGVPEAWDAASSAPEIAANATESAGPGVTASFTYSVFQIGPDGAPLTLTTFEASDEVPVVLSSDLASEAGLEVGDEIAVVTDSAAVSAVVAGTVGYVPGHPHTPSLWADREALRRAVLSVDSLDLLTDAWWGSSLDAQAAGSLRADGFGPVTSRTEKASDLTNDPAQVPLRLAWLLAIVAAAALAVTGGAAHAAAEAQHRSVTLARLRAIGVGKTDALRSHLLQHVLAMGGAIVAGIAAGLALAALVAPALVVSPAGDRPVPPAVLVFPVPAVLAVGGGVLALVLAAGIPAARAAVSRSTVAALRAGEVT
jgi:hypothetical protein